MTHTMNTSGKPSPCRLLEGVAFLLLLASTHAQHSSEHGGNMASPEVTDKATIGRLVKFVDPLPMPEVIDAANVPKDADGIPTIVIGAFVTMQKFHRDLPPTKVYAFGTSASTASVPGPTIIAHAGQAVRVKWLNNISDHVHMLPIDHTLMAPKPVKGGVPISIHVHGAQVGSAHDGHPDAWWTQHGETGPTYATNEHVYFNRQPASTLWYHDHTVGMTRLNMLAGLYGLFCLKDVAVEKPMRLPGQGVADYDVPLVIQDRAFTKDGSTFMSAQGVSKLHPQWIPEYFGNFMTVNGKVHPFMTVARRKYRFRLVNAANARFLELSLRAAPPVSDDAQTRAEKVAEANNTSYGMGFVQIAAESGYLARPVFQRRITISPGERACIVIDFTDLPAGSIVRMKNRAPGPYPDGDPVVGDMHFVMQFHVEGDAVVDESQIPAELNAVPDPDLTSIAVTREITLTEVEDVESGEPAAGLMEGKHYMEPVSINAKFGTSELWYFINLSEDTHPIHIHFGPHRLLFRRPFNGTLYEQKACGLNAIDGSGVASGLPSCYTGRVARPFRNERAYKDTSRAPPGYVTAVLMDFKALDGAELPFDPSAGPSYMIHCHILDHEDNDMMRPFTITK